MKFDKIGRIGKDWLKSMRFGKLIESVELVTLGKFGNLMRLGKNFLVPLVKILKSVKFVRLVELAKLVSLIKFVNFVQLGKFCFDTIVTNCN